MLDMVVLFFVMILNVEIIDLLLVFYVFFVWFLKCVEYVIINILSEKDLMIEKKIVNMKFVIGIKVGFYLLWLLVVDNVVSLL